MALPAVLVDTTQADLEQLITDQVQEGPHIEFKRELPGAWSNELKHEFLADTSAFANAGGGDLIFGIEEDGNGQARAIVAQTLTAFEQDIRRLQDYLINAIEPRISGAQVHAVPVTTAAATGHVIIVRVPQSWASPHRVRTNQHFFVREGARKRQLDVPEIRSLFLRSDNQQQRVRDFRTDRLGKILSGETPHRLVPGAVLVVHLIPSDAALGRMEINPVVYSTQRRLAILARPDGEQARLNIDGALAIRNAGAHGTHGYTQFFRNGFLESVMVLTFDGGNTANLAGQRYEEQIIEFLQAIRNELALLNVSKDMAVMLSLLRANQTRLGLGQGVIGLDEHQGAFDRPTVMIPDVLTDGLAPAAQALKPVFDLVWQAAGMQRSLNYDPQGRWRH